MSFDGPLLMVDDIVIMNVGEKKARTKILSEGVGLILTGKDDNGRAALNNLGQRQAILHDIAAIIGSKAEIGRAILYADGTKKRRYRSDWDLLFA